MIPNVRKKEKINLHKATNQALFLNRTWCMNKSNVKKQTNCKLMGKSDQCNLNFQYYYRMSIIF